MTIRLPKFIAVPAICASKACGAEFVKTTPGQRYCARACMEASSRERWRVKHPATEKRELTITCAHCETIFVRKSFEGQVARFCSRRCAQADRFRRVTGELSEIRSCGQKCESCGLDVRLIESGELSCWLKVCPNRSEHIDEAKLDQLASELAVAGLDLGERNDT